MNVVVLEGQEGLACQLRDTCSILTDRLANKPCFVPQADVALTLQVALDLGQAAGLSCHAEHHTQDFPDPILFAGKDAPGAQLAAG